ncbi:MAG: DUF4058 family protein [Armatimonadota bacterium]|nr:DUF4058 family protein [Armatimonadota bacterium]
MPSPFPGMDPYLENPARWNGAHQALVTYISGALNALLPECYVASIGERIFYPKPQPGKALSDERREVFVEILPVADQDHAVTVIEVLSIENKTAGSEQRDFYLARQQELLESQSHFIAIDLLRQGEHTVATPRPRLPERSRCDYLACLHRGSTGRRFEVWPIPLRQRLPRISVPLANGDPDLVIDLQAIFNRCYDEGAFVRMVDYRRDPTPELSPADAAWADALLREKGLRH